MFQDPCPSPSKKQATEKVPNFMVCKGCNHSILTKIITVHISGSHNSCRKVLPTKEFDQIKQDVKIWWKELKESDLSKSLDKLNLVHLLQIGSYFSINIPVTYCENKNKVKMSLLKSTIPLNETKINSIITAQINLQIFSDKHFEELKACL